MTPIIHSTDSASELFDNLKSMCDERPSLPGLRQSAEEAKEYEGHEGYDRLMAQGLPLEVEWGTERLA
jgi:hypothetical protein